MTRIEQAITDLGADLEPRPGWQQRVLDACSPIDALVAAVRALGPEASGVTIHFAGDSTEIRIRTRSDIDAAMVAARFGCTSTRTGRGGGYEWTQYRTPGFWDAGVHVEVGGPSRRISEGDL